MSHIKNDTNQINNKVLLSLDSCLIQGVLTIPLPKLKQINRMFFLNDTAAELSRPGVRQVAGTYQNSTWNLCCDTRCNWGDIYFIDTSFVTSVLSKSAYK